MRQISYICVVMSLIKSNLIELYSENNYLFLDSNKSKFRFFLTKIAQSGFTS